MIHGRQVFRVADDFRGHLSKGKQIPRDRPVVFVQKFQPLLANLLKLLSLLGAWLTSNTAQGRRIEVVISKNDVAKSLLIQFIRFFDNFVGETLARFASVRYPY